MACSPRRGRARTTELVLASRRRIVTRFKPVTRMLYYTSAHGRDWGRAACRLPATTDANPPGTKTSCIILLFKTGRRPALRQAALSARKGVTQASWAEGMHEQHHGAGKPSRRMESGVRREGRPQWVQCEGEGSACIHRRHILTRLVHALGSHLDATAVVSRGGRHRHRLWFRAPRAPRNADVRRGGGSPSTSDVICSSFY